MGSLSHYQQGVPARERVRIAVAIVLAAVAGFLAWLGLSWRYSSGGFTAPLGSSEAIEIGAPIALGMLMIVAAWLVRGVVLARLQVAVLLSLMLHLLLLFLLQLVHLPTLLAQSIEPAEIAGEREVLAMPDYGGMEAPEPSPELWQTEVAVETPQRQLESPSRQSTDPERPREIEMPQEMPETRTEAAEVQQVRHETAPHEMSETQREELARQSLQQPDLPDQPAELPELNDSRVAEMTAREADTDVTKQTVDPSRPNRESQRDQLPAMNRSAALEQPSRPDINPSEPDQARSNVARNTQSPSAADAAIESAQLAAERRASEFSPSESGNELDRRRAELAQRAAESPAQRLGETRSAAASLSPSRSERSAEVSGGSGAPQMARTRSGAGLEGAEGQIEAPQVTGGSPSAREPQVEPGQSGVARSATGHVSGPRGSASSLDDNTSLSDVGSGGTVSVGRAPARDAVGAPLGEGGGSPASLARSNVGGGAAGATDAGGGVQVSEAPGGGGSMEITPAPGASNVGRSSGGQVPTRVGSGRATSPGGTAPRIGTTPGTSGIARGGASGRGSESAARLGSDTAGAGRPGGGLSGRSAPAAGGPQGVSGGIENESMALTPGPQPGGGLAPGPQPGGSVTGSGGAGAGSVAGTGSRTSLPRRSAGLPGSSGTGGGQGFEGTVAGGGARTSVVGAPERRTQGDSPEMRQIESELTRQAVGLGKAGLAEMSPAFSRRSGEMRKEAARTLGGTPETERAVEMGIAWLAQHQAPDGSWGIHDFAEQCKGHECDGAGSFESPTAGTGLALLAFLGAGYTHQTGQYQETVARGLQWLVRQQKADGDLFSSETQFVRFYSHGIAAIALCEAYGMTKDPTLREPTQKALQFILDTQHPQLGGWRYEARTESDTSVSGWQLMALKSGEMAGFTIPPAAYQKVTQWLDRVERGAAGGLYAYHPTRPVSLAMTAEGLLMRQYLGFSRDNPRLRAGADHLDANLPDLNERDAYYWYYATQMMYHMQGTHWEHWNARLRDMLTAIQSKEGGTYGSWSPNEPTTDRWGAAGGRLYITCMHLLMLEVYYRHLPLYQQLER